MVVRKVQYLLRFILLLNMSLYSQQKNTLNGIVFLANKPEADVNIKNLNTNKTFLTNHEGEFTLTASPKDSLLFSSVQLINLKMVLSEKDFESGTIKVEMKEKENILNEVKIYNNSKINAYDLGIVNKKIKTLTPAEKRLKTAGDFKTIHLLGLLVGALDVDALLNKVSGRTKQLKKELVIEKKEINIQFLKDNFYDYLNKQMKIPAEMIQKVFYYAVEDELFQDLLEKKENEKIKFNLLDYYQILKELEKK